MATTSPNHTTGALALVVEDEPLVAEMLAEFLGLEGLGVDRARNGREAMTRIHDRAYRLIVSDLRMPDVDGPAFYRELSSVAPDLATRVVFVTGDMVNPEVQRFLVETGVPCLEKPFDLKSFQRFVRRALAPS